MDELGELIPCGGGDPIPLLAPKLLVGRQPSCDITLRFPNVSSRHCVFEFEKGFWFVRDLGSSNGIKVNNIRCESRWLRPGDVISIAKHRYEISYVPQGEHFPEVEEDAFATGLLEKAGLKGRRSRNTAPQREAGPKKEAPTEPSETPPPKRRARRNDILLDQPDDSDLAKWLGQ